MNLSFTGSFILFIVMAACHVLAARNLGIRIGGRKWADAALGAVVVFFGTITLTGAILGFTGLFKNWAFLFVAFAWGGVAVAARPRVSIPFPRASFKPAAAGFFLP